jgi:hypothetical protein
MLNLVLKWAIDDMGGQNACSSLQCTSVLYITLVDSFVIISCEIR